MKVTESQIRVRIAHAHTLKDGWRLAETTVEWTGHGEPEWAEMAHSMAGAHRVGSEETRARRNAEEADGLA